MPVDVLTAAIAQQEARKVAVPAAQEAGAKAAAEIAAPIARETAHATAAKASTEWLTIHPPANGVDGTDGRDGIDGKAGLDGTDGLNGTAGQDGVGINWQGPWKARIWYQANDAVEFEGSSYIATGPSKGTKPPNGVWELMAQRGSDGRVIHSGRMGGGGSGTGSGSALTVLDEGVSLDAAVTSIDFTGTGLTATVVGHAVTVDGTAAAGAPTTADYLVGTAQAGLSAEIVVGTSPGGELGGTWASPTVDTTHSGSSHADFQPLDSDLTAIAALSTTAFGRSLLALVDPADGTKFLNGAGAFSVPPGSGSGSFLSIAKWTG